MKLSIGLLVALLTLGVWPFASSALTLEQTSLVVLMKSSDNVLRGIVQSVTPTDQEGGPTIVASIGIVEVLKGENLPAQVEVRFRGRLDEENLLTAPQHEATLMPDEVAVLFLTRLENGELVITDALQGKFIVSETEAGEDVVRCAIGPIPLADRDPEDWPAEMLLTDFEEHLRHLAAYPQ